MALKLAGHLFTGPFPIDTTEVRSNQAPVVYAIVAKGGEPWAPTFRVVDIGYSEESGVRFAELSNRTAWSTQYGTQVDVYLFYAPRSQYSLADRQKIADEIRQKYDPPKGLIEG